MSPHAVDGDELVARGVVVFQRLRLLAVDGQAVAHRLGPVVRALDDEVGVHVVGRRAEVQVIRLAGLLVNATLREAIHDLVVGHLEAEDGVDGGVVFFQERAQPLGLLRGARVAVEHEVVVVAARDGFFGELAHDLVGDERALLDVRLGFEADRRLFFHGRADDVAGRDLLDAERVFEEAGLRAFARAGRAE